MNKISVFVILVIWIASLSSCMVAGESAGWVNLELEIDEVAGDTAKFKADDAEIYSENKASFYVEVSAEDMSEKIDSADYLDKDSTGTTMSISLELPAGKQRKFDAVLFLVEESVFSAYKNNEEYFLDLDDGDNKNISVKVNEMSYGSMIATLNGISDNQTTQLYFVDKVTNIKLYGVDCADNSGEYSCTASKLPINRELIPVVKTDETTERILSDQSFSIPEENMQIQLTLELVS